MWLFIGATQVNYAERMDACAEFMRQTQKGGDALLADVSHMTYKSDGLNHNLNHFLSAHTNQTLALELQSQLEIDRKLSITESLSCC